MSDGMVFDIQHFCVDDGPGIRTTVFLKGCPLRCAWCHNAEGLSQRAQLYYVSDSCIRCGRCASVCPHGAHAFDADGKHTVDFSRCVACGACARMCPNRALRVVGKKMTSDEVIEKIIKDIPFYRTSGGGITVSGGEPLLQGEFCEDISRKAKDKGLHVCLETSGHGSGEVLRHIAKFTDLFLFDFKHYDTAAHKALTGVGNTVILDNLQLLCELGKDVILRCPIIPGRNDCGEHYRAIAELASRMKNIKEIHMEPYHPFGVSKYASLGLEAEYDREQMMDASDAESAAQQVRALTDTPVLIN